MSVYRPEEPKGLMLPQSAMQRQEMAEVINSTITRGFIVGGLKRIQEPAAPSGTEIYTRTPVLEAMLVENGISRAEFTHNFVKSESPALWMNTGRQSVVVNCQLDDLGFLPPVGGTRELTFPLQPNFNFNQSADSRYPGKVVRYIRSQKRYEYICEGEIVTDESAIVSDGQRKPTFHAEDKPANGFTPKTDRVVYSPKFRYDEATRIVTGKTDGPAASIAGFAAAVGINRLMQQFGIKPSFGIVWAGEEEGLANDNTMFAHGARIMVNNMTTEQLPDLAIIVDGHDFKNGLPGVGVWGEFVSQGKGKTVAPHHADPFEEYLQSLYEYDVQTGNTFELGGTLSRSDDVSWRPRVKRTIAFGHDGDNYHFTKALPTTHVDSVVNLARGLVWVAVGSQNT